MLGQKKLLQRIVPGLMHAFIFWGFLVLFPTIVMAMIAAVDKHAELPWLGHQTWFGWLADLFVVLVLAGVAAAVVIRKVVRPPRFQGSHVGEADFILFMIAGVVATLLLWHAAAHAAGLNGHVGPLSDAIAKGFPRHGLEERVFVVVKQERPLTAVLSTMNLCQSQTGRVLISGTWFKLAHLGLFIGAVGAAFTVLAAIGALGLSFVLFLEFWIAVLYFAAADFLYTARLAAYVTLVGGAEIIGLAAKIAFTIRRQCKAHIVVMCVLLRPRRYPSAAPAPG